MSVTNQGQPSAKLFKAAGALTPIEKRLSDLFKVDPSEWASHFNPVTTTGSRYEIFVSSLMGGLHDIVKVHEALEHVGLVTNSRHPYVEHGIGTTDGHITLGYGDGKGGFYDKVQLSDNAAALAKLDQGFSFEVDFGNRPDTEVAQLLSEAIKFIMDNRNEAILKKAAKKRELEVLAKMDRQYEAIAVGLQNAAGRNDLQDEDTVATYIKKQLQENFPETKVSVSLPEKSPFVEHVYGVKTQERNIEIKLMGDEARKFRDSSWSDNCRYMDAINNALKEKLSLTRSSFAKISGVRGDILTGSVIGSSARLAAELNHYRPEVGRFSRPDDLQCNWL